MKQFVWILIVWAFPFLKKERGGLFTPIFPSANWRKGRIYVTIPKAASNIDNEILLFYWVSDRITIEYRFLKYKYWINSTNASITFHGSSGKTKFKNNESQIPI